jgi:hypothetical protein
MCVIDDSSRFSSRTTSDIIIDFFPSHAHRPETTLFEYQGINVIRVNLRGHILQIIVHPVDGDLHFRFRELQIRSVSGSPLKESKAGYQGILNIQGWHRGVWILTLANLPLEDNFIRGCGGFIPTPREISVPVILERIKQDQDFLRIPVFFRPCRMTEMVIY